MRSGGTPSVSGLHVFVAEDNSDSGCIFALIVTLHNKFWTNQKSPWGYSVMDKILSVLARTEETTINNQVRRPICGKIKPIRTSAMHLYCLQTPRAIADLSPKATPSQMLQVWNICYLLFSPVLVFLYIPNLLAFAHTLNQGKFSINTYFWQVLSSLQMGLTIFLLFSWHCWKLALSIAWVFLLLHNSRYLK